MTGELRISLLALVNFDPSKNKNTLERSSLLLWRVANVSRSPRTLQIQINTMCICVSLSAYVTLFCLFSPKISIILLHPDKNVRKLTMNSATYKRPFKPIPHATASAEARINATSATYNGAHIDGCSGGPMSTTSQVLNLGESQSSTRSICARSIASVCGFMAHPTRWWPASRRMIVQCCSVGELSATISTELDSLEPSNSTP